MPASRILIVEDERIIAEDIRTSLTGLGYDVTGVASSGEEALNLVEKEKPDLVLMDIVLKGAMTGIEAARRLYDRMQIPVVYLTAYAEKVSGQEAQTAPSFGYIIKPFLDNELKDAINKALERKGL
jgi:CheY-like chemotaxis protein